MRQEQLSNFQIEQDDGNVTCGIRRVFFLLRPHSSAIWSTVSHTLLYGKIEQRNILRDFPRKGIPLVSLWSYTKVFRINGSKTGCDMVGALEAATSPPYDY